MRIEVISFENSLIPEALMLYQQLQFILINHNSNEPLSLAINAQWGAGKTTLRVGF